MVAVNAETIFERWPEWFDECSRRRDAGFTLGAVMAGV